MTKKDYEAIARAISRAKAKVQVLGFTSHDRQSVKAGILQVQMDLVIELQNDNPRFDKDKFQEACKVK